LLRGSYLVDVLFQQFDNSVAMFNIFLNPSSERFLRLLDYKKIKIT
jgi:hypothetical protein